MAMDGPKCWSAFRQEVLQGEATFTSISGGEGEREATAQLSATAAQSSAVGKASRGSWGQLGSQQGGTSADLLGEDRRANWTFHSDDLQRCSEVSHPVAAISSLQWCLL